MKPIEGFPDYRITATGKVFSTKHDGFRELKPTLNKGDRYPIVYLWLGRGNGGHKIRVHRLVAETFLGKCPDAMECNHKDGNKTNNHVENLEWVTRSQNVSHAIRIGLRMFTPLMLEQVKNMSVISGKNRRKLTIERAMEIRKSFKSNPCSYRTLAKQYGVSYSVIRYIIIGKTYADALVYMESLKEERCQH